MLRHLMTCVSTAALLASSPAFADLIIDIPDVPEFTLSDPIISDEDVIINALPGTTLIIDTRIEAPNLTIVAGSVLELDGGELLISGATMITAGGSIILDGGGSLTTDEITVAGGNGGDVIFGDVTADFGVSGGTLTVTTASGAGIGLTSVSSPPRTPVVLGGGVSLAGGSGLDLTTTTVSISDEGGRAVGNATIVAAGPIVVTNITIQNPAGADVVGTGLADAEAPVAIIETNLGQVALVLDGSALAPLEVDLGGASLPSELLRASDFTDRLFSCPQSAPDVRFDEGTCAYATGGVDRLESDNGASTFDDTTWAFTLGAQAEVADDVFVGGALAYEASQTDTRMKDRETRRGRTGLVVKYDDGAFSAGLALAAAYGAVDTARATASGLVSGSTDATTLEARARIAYGMRFGDVAVEPSLAASVLHLEEDGYTETGAALANRRVGAADLTTFGLHAGLTLGTDLVAGPFNTSIRPELAVGLDWLSDPDATLSATGATGRALFQNVDADRLTGTVSVGLTVFAADDVAFRLRYGGRFGENTSGHGGEIKATLGF
ncbi:MAG: autotransporter outer membrane beta-barrel domain-containing protein [Pseudomonadota bacterium]